MSTADAAGGASGADPGKGKQWTRSDRISLAAVIAATLAFLVAAIQPMSSIVHYFSRPRVTIESPSNGMNMPNNTFGAWGTAQHVPPTSDLWLVVRSGVEGRWYPIYNLSADGGKWAIRNDRICPGSGLQDIQIYLVPNMDEGELFSYIKGDSAQQGLGINSMPPDAVLEATSSINVAGNSRTSC